MSLPPEGTPPPYQPPHGQYPPPSYPPPPNYQQPQGSLTPPGYQQPVPQAQTTSGFAVAALVLGIVGFTGAFVLSAIFGFIALGKTKPGAQRGRGMAIAGLVLSGAWAAIIAIATVIGALSPTSTVSAQDVKAGECFADVPSGNRVSSVDTISCDRPHSAEVVAVLTMPSGSFPDESVFSDYKQKCRNALQSYSSSAMQDPNVDLAVMSPTPDSWRQGDHTMDCIATFSTQRSGSIKG